MMNKMSKSKKGVITILAIALLSALFAPLINAGVQWVQSTRYYPPADPGVTVIDRTCPEGNPDCDHIIHTPDLEDADKVIRADCDISPYYIGRFSGEERKCYIMPDIVNETNNGKEFEFDSSYWFDSLDRCMQTINTPVCPNVEISKECGYCGDFQIPLTEDEDVCPKLYGVFPDVWCQIKTSVGSYFHNIKLSLAIFVGLLAALVAIPLIRDTVLNENENTPVVYVLALVLGGVAGYMLFTVFWVGIGVVLAYLALSVFLNKVGLKLF